MKNEKKNSELEKERADTVLQKIKLEKQRLQAQNRVLVKLVDNLTAMNDTIENRTKIVNPKRKRNK